MCSCPYQALTIQLEKSITPVVANKNRFQLILWGPSIRNIQSVAAQIVTQSRDLDLLPTLTMEFTANYSKNFGTLKSEQRVNTHTFLCYDVHLSTKKLTDKLSYVWKKTGKFLFL